MTDPQIWTLIGVFAAAMLGGFSLVVSMMSRVVRSEIGGLRGEIRGELAGLHGQIAGLRGEISGLNTRFDTLEKRFDHVDRDVQAITDRMWRDRDS